MKLNQGSQSLHKKGPGGQCKGSSEPGGDGQTGNAWCPRIPGIPCGNWKVRACKFSKEKILILCDVFNVQH